jgi:preprotein translocase subunit SecE
MTRKSTRNYSLSVVAASVASAAILALLVAAALKLG